MNVHTKSRCLYFAVAVAALTFTLHGNAAESRHPVVAIYTEHSGFAPAVTNSRPQVIVALWADGRVVWSRDSVRGGPPYLQGAFPEEKLQALLDTWGNCGLFRDESLRQTHFGPDASFTTIRINDDRRQLKMQSWHELFESDTNLVALSTGITSLAGKSREQVLKDEPKGYQMYRKTWSEIRAAVGALIPQTGTPYKSSEIQFVDDVLNTN